MVAGTGISRNDTNEVGTVNVHVSLVRSSLFDVEATKASVPVPINGTEELDDKLPLVSMALNVGGAAADVTLEG